ncbi:MAG TPA: hypothetical protein VGD39_04955 [Nocardioides sp.]
MTSHPDDAETEDLLGRLAETFPPRDAPLPALLGAARRGRRRRLRRLVATGAVARAVVVAGAAASLSAIDRPDTRIAADRTPPAPCTPGGERSPGDWSPPRGPDYPTNADGLTYGAQARDSASLPDLVAVVGDCGATGYVLRSDLEDEAPWEPGAGDGGPRTFPVFESDGVTQVDTYTRPGQVASGDETAPGAGSGVSGADLQWEWGVVIAGVVGEDGTEQYDTYRDIDLRLTGDGDRLEVWDGCRRWAAGFDLVGGDFALTGPWQAVESTEVDCARAAPLTEVVDNVRHVSRAGRRAYLHLANGQIVLVLTPAGA